MGEQEQIKKPSKSRKIEEVVEDVIPDQTEAKEAVAKTDELLDEIDSILDYDEPVLKNKEGGPLTLADLMREGCEVSQPLIGNWIKGGQACAFGAAEIAAQKRGLV